MDTLPHDLVLEIAKRMNTADVVSLAATSKEYHGLMRRAFHQNLIKRSVLDKFAQLMHKLAEKGDVLITRSGFISCFYDMPQYQFSQHTTALHSCPSRWTTYLHGEVQLDEQVVPVIVAMRLTVIPKRELKDWVFRFAISFYGPNAPMLQSEFEHEALYEITTRKERLNAGVALLASWYGQAKSTLGGRRLRSHAKKAWLPEKMPSAYNMMRAAYRPLYLFVNPPCLAGEGGEDLQ